jgi:hypothetical protein
MSASLLSLLILLATDHLTHADDNPLRTFFPYGVYIGGNNPMCEPEWDARDREAVAAAINRACRDLAEHHMNAAWPNNLMRENIELWLAAGRRHGVRIVPQGGGPPMFLRPAWFNDKQDLIKKVGDFYRPLAEAHRDDPALLAWSLTEENAYLPWFHEGIGDLVRLMDQWDPNHPGIVMDNQAPGAWMVAQVIKPKALVMDSYPFFADGMGGPVEPIGHRSLWRRQCRRMRHAAESIDAPYWMIGQGMKLTNMRGRGQAVQIWRYPTAAEIRWQFWSALQEGATGLFYFAYAGHSQREQGESMEGLRGPNMEETVQFREAAELGRTLKQMAPLLLGLDVAPVHQQVEYWENTPVTAQTHVHRQTGQRFMSVVNDDCERIQRVGIELGYWPRMLGEDDRLFDLRSDRKFDYQSIKTATLLPGDGTIYFVGTEEQWKTFSEDFYPQ